MPVRCDITLDPETFERVCFGWRTLGLYHLFVKPSSEDWPEDLAVGDLYYLTTSEGGTRTALVDAIHNGELPGWKIVAVKPSNVVI